MPNVLLQNTRQHAHSVRFRTKCFEIVTLVIKWGVSGWNTAEKCLLHETSKITSPQESVLNSPSETMIIAQLWAIELASMVTEMGPPARYSWKYFTAMLETLVTFENNAPKGDGNQAVRTLLTWRTFSNTWKLYSSDSFELPRRGTNTIYKQTVSVSPSTSYILFSDNAAILC
ncbi:hypothetical protein BASA83_011317 [Batrachochytrium salamandrivorans]|nr:hypothetical protein BASA83_011317 [Batrachochytrium salamandrivorans]